MKNIYLRVYPPHGQVKVTAPYRATNALIEDFVRGNWDRIIAQVQRCKQVGLDLEAGKEIKLWGQAYPLEIKRGKKSRALVEGDRVILEIAGKDDQEKRDKVLREFYRSLLVKEAGPLVNKYEEAMGLKIGEVRTKKMKTRWGTCNIRDRRVWLSLNLVHYPKECLEMVLVHEMVHLVEKKHNSQFYRILSQYYPKWKEVDEILRG